MEDHVSDFISTLEQESFDGQGEKADAAGMLAEELTAIRSIYGDDRLELLDPSGDTLKKDIAFVLSVPLTCHDQEMLLRIRIDLPENYPATQHKPTLQLLNRYIGNRKLDATAHDVIASIFSTESSTGIVWEKNTAMLFEGIEYASEYLRGWYERVCESDDSAKSKPTDAQVNDAIPPNPQNSREKSIPFVCSDKVVERKSEFLGHAAQIHHPDDVPIVLSSILESDKRIQRATHPLIHAWVCRTSDNILHHDCDDDGETAAGTRLAHLLSVLGVENAIVVVTRWYGGVLLGADRFKQINRVARQALMRAELVSAKSS
ncbi:hypothetical protein MYAM1_002328 [Malassezia yamatoensis]|uniref:RWD domain-containing protein n=1 Tax=Malassezia yamatoensis TaxID=253288 RepID=A0AAJ6CI81_9BASI|nr:hypothetical protein MYAM1_002328 [Malassezia yamatoensis]